MTSMIRSVIAAGFLAGAFAIAAPHDAVAQGKGNKGAKAEQKVEKRIDKPNRKATGRVVRTTRRSSTTYRTRVLCEDGIVVLRSTNACAGHGGFASRQGTLGTYPPASDRARARANANSAVVRGIGANNVRTYAIARCNDGTYWHSTTRTGACYRHGGVATWY